MVTLLIVGLTVASFVVPAAAQELFIVDEPAPEPEAEYVIDYHYDPEAMVMFFGLVEEDAEEPDCTPESGDYQVSIDPETGDVVFEGDFELPEGCVAIPVAGPNGQVNHGQIVSHTVHALKDIHDKSTHGPFGQFVKEVAGDKELGKGDRKVKPHDDDGDDGDEDDLDDGMKPEKREKPDKPKKPKKPKKNR